MTRMFSYWTRKNKMTTGRGINLNESRKYLLITRFTKPMSEMRLTSILMFTKQIIFRHATLRAYVFYCTRAFLKFQSFLVEFLYLLHRIHCDKLICKKQKNDTFTSKRTLKKQPQCTQHPPDANYKKSDFLHLMNLSLIQIYTNPMRKQNFISRYFWNLTYIKGNDDVAWLGKRQIT